MDLRHFLHKAVIASFDIIFDDNIALLIDQEFTETFMGFISLVPVISVAQLRKWVALVVRRQPAHESFVFRVQRITHHFTARPVIRLWISTGSDQVLRPDPGFYKPFFL